MLDAWSRDCEADDLLLARPPSPSAPKWPPACDLQATSLASEEERGRKGPLLGLALSLSVHLCAAGALLWRWSAPPPEPVMAAAPEPILVTLPPLPKAPPERRAPGPATEIQTPRQQPAQRQPSVLEIPSQPERLALAPFPEPDSRSLDRAQTLPDLAPPPSIIDGRETFESLLQARIEQFRRYPDDALRRHHEGTVQVRFRMDRSGQVLDATVQMTSGVRQLDREALATIFRAQPLPRIPNDRPDVMTVLVPLEFRLKNQRALAWTETGER